jgi:hemerythrin-like domain-containing protein
VLTRCCHWDLRQQARSPAELALHLKALSHEEALLVASKTSFPEDWNQGLPLCLIEGPSLYLRIYVPPGVEPEALEQRRTEHLAWLEQFALLRQEALQGLDTVQRQERLTRSMKEHMDWEEREMFPELDRFLETTRLTRELGYEHQGIRRWLPQLQDLLKGLHPSSPWSEALKRKNWEKYALDLIHLVEHHIEHEERGAYPLYERLRQGRKGQDPGAIGG